MGNHHHSHLLSIEGGEVERTSGSAGKTYFCRTCGTDSCRHTKRARDVDSIHLAKEQLGRKH